MTTSSTSGRPGGSALGRKNFLLLGAGVVVLVAGYLLLSSGHASVAAAVLVLGYCVLVPLGLAL
ncbi:MAG TPA: hypothetical protein VLC11_05645 [Gemmatimonadales bacterium]|nr:hypothetical protein [Gemmatimonadales bacterium]